MCQSTCLQICGRQAVQIATLATTMYRVVWFRGFLCGNPRSRSLVWAPRNMLGRLSTGEKDAAIDIVRPRLRKWLDWEGKVLRFVIKRILKRYNSSSANISKMLYILSLYNSSLTQNLRCFWKKDVKFWIRVQLVCFFVKSYLDLCNKFSKKLRLNQGRL